MSNEYYNPSGTPASSSQVSSNPIRSEFIAMQTAFDKLPVMAGNVDKLVYVQSASQLAAATPDALGLATQVELDAAIVAEIAARNAAISVETNNRTAAILVETNARIAAINAEVSARNAAILVETNARLALANTIIGNGQAWTDVIGSRALNTVYTNSLARPIFILGYVTVTSSPSVIHLALSSISTMGAKGDSGAILPFSGIVPSGGTFELIVTSGAVTLTSWKELR